MDVYEADQRAADVRARASDPEVAHGLLDELWLDVLSAIAKGRLSGADAQRSAQLAIDPEGHITKWFA